MAQQPRDGGYMSNLATGYSALVTPEALDSLRARVVGEILTPADPAYAAARQVWNGMIDRRPAAIVRCRGTADVMAAVVFAGERGLPLSVRGGGHNVAGNALCDGLVVDLSLMNGVRVDPVRRTVRVGGGARLGDLDREAQAVGLAVPVGVVSRTGIAGLALHGGIGFLTRKYGLTCDNLIGADVVTADGRLLVVSEEDHPDLLWALRGGGGNFGAVTSLEFRAHPVGPDLWMAITFYPAERASDIVRTYHQYMAQASDDVTALVTFWTAGHEDTVPPEHRGKPVVGVAGCYAGPVGEGERVLAPLRRAADPLFDLSGPMPYLAVQTIFDPEYPDGRRYYWKSTYLTRLDDEVAAALAGHAARRPSPLTSLDIVSLGGVVGRTPPEGSAFAIRDAPYLLAIEANWIDPADDAANIAWARDVYADMRRFSLAGTYLNFPGLGEDGERMVRESYAGNYPRLQRIKAECDPHNVFRSNMNIRT